ncbi:23S rRNA (uracil1939-C5)-methyltransferase [Natranaerovirga pectinivora]|uniref:23S rRNA (Uracil1939-C5)-methyltransferase n=1 Tax=Natranaerovirga pectinivora TaxID=682400 RepID=A0A4R3MEH5_9FIRM|nr:23S rRNA (uracil(1939)-C(5))-methyltransferase RlmD [Natranaerovirga pectinivora]TCT12188.1 23S rRNA (uracil1939-C5)-methyltransferase [Natranaerovirga pectinivora]
MEIIKNEYYTMTIDDIGDGGEGIGKINGYTMFVKDALIGDEIKVKVIKTKKNYGFGKLEEIITPSPYRTEAPCPIAEKCGGCQIQHFDYKRQLQFKEEKVKNVLERIGGLKDIKVNEVMGMEDPYYYRNKAQFPVGKDKDGNIKIGYYAARSHNIIETEKCYIGDPINEVIIQKVKEYIVENNISVYNEEKHEGLIRHILTRVGYHTKELMVCLVINERKLPKQDALIKKLETIPNIKSICVNTNLEKTNVILGKKTKTIWGQDYITDKIGDVSYKISPVSFYQINPTQTEKLYNTALEYAGLTGEETVWDIYCGIGTITLFLAQKAKKVYGVEIAEQAIRDALSNAELNEIENVEFYVGKAEEVLPSLYEEQNIKADVIVVDPPRKGCDEELLDTIVKMAPKKVVYVSCDPATLARDLKYFGENGYTVSQVQPVDMFPHTLHVETCILIEKK